MDISHFSLLLVPVNTGTLEYSITKMKLEAHLAGIGLSHECLHNANVNYDISKLNYIFGVEYLNHHF